jgi:transposase
MARYDLSEAEWRLVEPLLPPVGKGALPEDDRRIVSGVFYVLRTGSPWRLAASCASAPRRSYRRRRTAP